MENNFVEVLGSIEASGYQQDTAKPDTIDIISRGRRHEIAVSEERFGVKFTDIPHGWNSIFAEFGSEKSRTVRVLAPRVSYHFDQGDREWAIRGSQHLAASVEARSSGGVSGGYLSTQREQEHLDVFFVVDTSISMKLASDSVSELVSSTICQLEGRNFDLRVGIVEFRDRPFLHVHDLSDSRADMTAIKIFDKGSGPKEDQHLAIVRAINGFDNSSSYRIVVVISDAPPHNDSESYGAIGDDVPVFVVIPRYFGPLTKIDQENFDSATSNAQAIAKKTSGTSYTFVVDQENIAEPLAEEIWRIIKDRQANSQWNWEAPTACINALRSASGEYLHFSITGMGSPKLTLYANDGSAFTLSLLSHPESWQSYCVRLDDSVHWAGIETEADIGPKTNSPAKLSQTLENLTRFTISSSAPSVGESMGLDRVIVTSASSFAAAQTSQLKELP